MGPPHGPKGRLAADADDVMVSRQAEELVQRWLEGAEQIKSMPSKAAAALGRRHSLE
jgi:hypothetical protein